MLLTKQFTHLILFVNSNDNAFINTINVGLLKYKMNKQKEPFLSEFFKLWMSHTSPITLMSRALIMWSLVLVNKLVTTI
jgi:hypothetical protein